MADKKILSFPQGLKVVITGGASGIGLKIAECFHEHDAEITICGSNGEKLNKCLKSHATWHGQVCDVKSPQQVDDFIQFAQKKMGGIDVLVNNAGIAGPTTTVENCSPEDWCNTMEVNINGVFYGIRSAVKALKKSKGSIINISSVAGRIGLSLRSPYCTSKFALQGLTESLAKELGPFGIRVNSILPGFVESERWTNTTTARAEALGITYLEMREKLLDKSSLKRPVSEEEVAQMCLYLCSPLGRNISGQSLSLCANVEYL
jgi:NAD(P)-dependent dehydrogenase (short-subunit alcohol dehydrogenase family)